MLNDNKETKICKKCGRELPLDRFRFSSANGHPYYRGLCKDCEGVYFKEHSKKKREKEFIFSDNVEIRIGREFKEINPARILNIADLGIIPCGTDEVFVRLMDYKDTWLSNYGRCITRTWGKYGLLDGSYIRGELRYSLRKNVFYDGKWIYKRDYAYAPKMVVETFIVNEDKANNIYVWHSGNDKEDCCSRPELQIYPFPAVAKQNLADTTVDIGIVEPVSYEESLAKVEGLSKGLKDILDEIYADVLNKEDFDW